MEDEAKRRAEHDMEVGLMEAHARVKYQEKHGFRQDPVPPQINRLFVQKLVDSIRAMSKMEHYHQFGVVDLTAMDSCDICHEMDRAINALENQLGPNPATVKTTEEFEHLIMNDPLSRRLWEMGRKYQADLWAEEKAKQHK